MPNADNTDTTVSEPTTEPTTAPEVDTSTNEEAPDTDVDMDLEDDETSFEDVDDDDTEDTDDSEDENEDTEPADTEEQSEDDDKQSESQDEESPDEESEDRTPSEDEIKKHNQEMAARRIAEKQAREAAKREQQAQYLEGAEDQTQLAVRQLQIDAYNNLVEKNLNSLDNDMQKAVANIDLFKDGSPEVQEELLRRAEDFEAKHVKYDSNGDPVAVNGSLYDYLQTEADSIRRILNTGARQQSKAKDKAKTRTDTLPSRAPKEPKVDPDLAAFDEEVAKWN